MLFRKRGIIIEAHRWWRNGDHPDDGVNRNEGLVVHLYRRPDIDAETVCGTCGYMMKEHGWIDAENNGYIVCPGDWIVTDRDYGYYPCKPERFDAEFEPAII
jgi:hypothetical protein